MRSILLILLLLTTKASFACKCMSLTEDELYTKAVEVLYVQILSTEYIEEKENHDSRVKAVYKILESFKLVEGSPSHAIEGLNNCAPNFMAGRKYILYLTENRYVSRCSGSMQLQEWTDFGKKKLEKLRKKTAF